ncbi:TonB-dependent receptor plug domain-containing protein [Aliarcobacter skirrowii]|uniref:TonB-dependent receptor plug domain-containing protein n=1 Tax=Aliarcobacter skirrowii TaxID=28200 RepID=UPI0021B35957|nr:TonB-dependent receptor [Aliarcobacter skirrowii]MCT7446551.1 TonB-dependent receptor [Aliarcobacter skirrowii]
MVRKLSFVVATTLFAGILLASETTNLGQIDIFEKSNTDSKFKSNEISAEEMELQNKNSVLEALNTISGLNTYGYGARGEQTISIRGFSGRHAPVFIDGIAINLPVEGYVDLSNYMTFNLDKIQVTKGLSSPLLGINTFAGAINLVTKRPTKELEGTLSTGVFSGKGRKSYLNLATNQGLYYVQASGSVMERDYYPMSSDYKKTDVQDSNKRVNSYKNDQNINLKVGFTPNETDEYAFNYINQKTDKGMPTDINYDPATHSGGSPFRQWDYSNKESFYFLSNTNFDLGYIKSRVFYDKYEDNMLFFTDNSFSTIDGTPTPYDASTKGISLELGQYDTLRNSLKLALHAKQDIQKDNDSGKVYTKKMNYFSIGLEDTFRVTDDFRIIAGASWDKDDVREANNKKPGKAAGDEFEHTSSDSFNPMIKVEYDIDESFSTYAGVAKKTRFASLKERYSYRMGKAIPNPELEPEKTINYEIGASKLYENQGIKAVLFYSDVKDYIQERVVDNPDFDSSKPINKKNPKEVNQNYNVGKVKHMGYELEYFYAFGNNLDFDASYTRLLAEDKDKKDLITDAPKHKIALSATYRPIKGLTTNVNMQFSSSRHTDSKSNAKDVSSAAIWNAKIAYEIKKGLTFDLGASNIFDKNYEYSYGYPEAGRVVYSNITYKF